LAGQWAAEKRPLAEYYTAVRQGVDRQYQWCGWLRGAIRRRWPLRLAPLLPPSWLYAVTRPKLESR
jgi:hypothetical protein